MYYEELNVNGHIFYVSVDGLCARTQDDVINDEYFEALKQAVKIYDLVSWLVEEINCSGVTLTDLQSAKEFIRKIPKDIVKRENILIVQKLAAELNIILPPKLNLVFIAFNPPINISYEKPAIRSAGFVYLLQSPSGAYKIGRAKDINNRMKIFEVKLPFEVELLHKIPCQNYISAEICLHKRYEGKRIKGEWFALSDEDVVAIRSIQSM